jgi:hypothetical protein
MTGLAAAVGNLINSVGSKGGASAAGGRSFKYDEGAPKGQGSGSGSAGGGGGDAGGGSTSGGGGITPQETNSGGGKQAKAVAFPKWFPACVFMDGSVRNGNQVVKGLVDMAAQCGVNLVVFPFYSKNMPGDAGGLKEAARKKCNAQDGFRQFGSTARRRLSSREIRICPRRCAMPARIRIPTCAVNLAGTRGRRWKPACDLPGASAANLRPEGPR